MQVATVTNQELPFGLTAPLGLGPGGVRTTQACRSLMRAGKRAPNMTGQVPKTLCASLACACPTHALRTASGSTGLSMSPQ